MNIVVVEAGALPASVFFFGDTHVGNAGCDLYKLADAVKYIKNVAKERTVITVGMGDFIDAITLDDKRFNPQEIQKDFPVHDVARSQMRKFYNLTRDVWEVSKYAIALIGNHEEKIISRKHFDVYRYLVEDLADGKIMQAGFECLIRLLFKGNGTARFSYDIYATHGGIAGGWREGAGINAIYDLSRYFLANAYIVGHLHKLEARTSAFTCLNSVHKLSQVVRHYGISGTFLSRTVDGHRSYMEGRRGEPSLMGFLELKIFLKDYQLKTELYKIIL